MIYLGICTNSGAIYEGLSTSSGYRVLPTPILVPVRFSDGGPLAEIVDHGRGLADMIFREDDFDAVTKIRRGRVFNAKNQSQPWKWYVQDPNRRDLKTTGPAAVQQIDLFTFQRDPLSELRGKASQSLPKVVLGADPYKTFWRIVSIESSVSGTPVLTLKAHHSLSDLPALALPKIPVDVRKPITDAVEKVEASLDRLSPTDVIDRCRDALGIVFGTLAGDRGKDLVPAISAFVTKNGGKEGLSSWAGLIVGRLHARGKPNEQHARSVRPPSDEDAQLAVRCLCFVLVENGWAE